MQEKLFIDPWTYHLYVLLINKWLPIWMILLSTLKIEVAIYMTLSRFWNKQKIWYLFEPKRSFFSLIEGKLLGIIFSKKGIIVAPDRLKSIFEISLPHSKKSMQSLLGQINFIECFVPYFSQVIMTLQNMISKNFTNTIMKSHKQHQNIHKMERHPCNPKHSKPAIESLQKIQIEFFVLKNTEKLLVGLKSYWIQAMDGRRPSPELAKPSPHLQWPFRHLQWE